VSKTYMTIIVLIGLLILSSAMPVEPVQTNNSNDTNAKFSVKKLLTNNGIQVISMNVSDGRSKGGFKSMIIAYESTAKDVSGLVIETGKILGFWLGQIKGGWDCDDLYAVIGDISGKAIAKWHGSKDWKDAYLRGDLTDNQLITNVTLTMTKV
jgi:hypothetical protein